MWLQNIDSQKSTGIGHTPGNRQGLDTERHIVSRFQKHVRANGYLWSNNHLSISFASPLQSFSNDQNMLDKSMFFSEEPSHGCE